MEIRNKLKKVMTLANQLVSNLNIDRSSAMSRAWETINDHPDAIIVEFVKRSTGERVRRVAVQDHVMNNGNVLFTDLAKVAAAKLNTYISIRPDAGAVVLAA